MQAPRRGAPPPVRASDSTARVEAAGRRHQNRHANTDMLTRANAGPPDHGLTSPLSNSSWQRRRLRGSRRRPICCQIELRSICFPPSPARIHLSFSPPRGSAAAKRRRVACTNGRVQEALRTSCCLTDESPLRWVRDVARSGLHVHCSALLMCVWRCLHVHGCPAAPPVGPLYSF